MASLSKRTIPPTRSASQINEPGHDPTPDFPERAHHMFSPTMTDGSIRIKLALVESELAQVRAEKAAAEQNLRTMQMVTEITARHADELAKVHEAICAIYDIAQQLLRQTQVSSSNTHSHSNVHYATYDMVQQLVERTQVPSSYTSYQSNAHGYTSPRLSAIDRANIIRYPSPPKLDDDFDDIYSKTPPKIDTSPSKKSHLGNVLIDLEDLPRSNPRVIRRFSSGLTESDAAVFDGNTSSTIAHKRSRFSPQNLASDTSSELRSTENLVRHRETTSYDPLYKPSPKVTNTHRTLIITNLPSNVTLSELLGQVRGGTVVSCQLLDTVPITGSFSALLRFLNEAEALAYDDFVHAHEILIRDRRLWTNLVPTASWPLSEELKSRIFEAGQTRCVLIAGFNENIGPDLMRRFLRFPSSKTNADGLEGMNLHQGRGLELRFASIDYASKACDKVMGHRAFRRCRLSFAKDPCTEPLETLLGDKKAQGVISRAQTVSPLTLDDTNQPTSLLTEAALTKTKRATIVVQPASKNLKEVASHHEGTTHDSSSLNLRLLVEEQVGNGITSASIQPSAPLCKQQIEILRSELGPSKAGLEAMERKKTEEANAKQQAIVSQAISDAFGDLAVKGTMSDSRWAPETPDLPRIPPTKNKARLEDSDASNALVVEGHLSDSGLTPRAANLSNMPTTDDKNKLKILQQLEREEAQAKHAALVSRAISDTFDNLGVEGSMSDSRWAPRAFSRPKEPITSDMLLIDIS